MKFFPKTRRKLGRIIGVSLIKDDLSNIKDLGQKMWQTKSSSPTQSARPIDEKITSPTQQQTAKKRFQQLLVFYLVLLVLSVMYLAYALSHGDYRLALVIIAMSCLFAAQSFKYHFWLYQLRLGQLGCSFQDWLKDFLGTGR